MNTTDSGLQYEDVQEGTGASPQRGQTCVMHYTGWLWEDGQKGTKFDSSVDRGQPFQFKLGVGQVIRGWDEGVATMKPGGKRNLLIPADLGYGARAPAASSPPTPRSSSKSSSSRRNDRTPSRTEISAPRIPLARADPPVGLAANSRKSLQSVSIPPVRLESGLIDPAWSC